MVIDYFLIKALRNLFNSLHVCPLCLYIIILLDVRDLFLIMRNNDAMIRGLLNTSCTLIWNCHLRFLQIIIAERSQHSRQFWTVRQSHPCLVMRHHGLGMCQAYRERSQWLKWIIAWLWWSHNRRLIIVMFTSAMQKSRFSGCYFNTPDDSAKCCTWGLDIPACLVPATDGATDRTMVSPVCDLWSRTWLPGWTQKFT